ncbi:Pycsar system effector family protein [Enterococcus spodopteracolus]|uniref:Pycsar system effector family protein n=1 Tax=Enterococcus spodopteracolus TaxID=3034501 RepID=UPI0026498218|nr:Pycsar system effector family protein [Enterococcus spodopteracolus]
MNKIDYEKRNEELYQRMDRINEWIKSCDNKTSILLATFGIFSSIFISDFFRNKCISIARYMLDKVEFGSILYLFTFSIFIVSLGVGLFYLVKELSPKLSFKNINSGNSLIFFGSIGDKTYDQFKQLIDEEEEENTYRDIIYQIYINSKICADKHMYAKKGLSFLQ